MSGGHLAGSQDFELVAWSQGMVRHNFVRTGGTANGAPSPAELRVMYVVGVMADLEYSLRAVAAATRKGDVWRDECPAGGADETSGCTRFRSWSNDPLTAAGARGGGDGRAATGKRGGNHGGGRRGRQSGVRIRRASRRQPTCGDRPAAAAAESIQELAIHHRDHRVDTEKYRRGT